jgi:hypothetical protein
MVGYVRCDAAAKRARAPGHLVTWARRGRGRAGPAERAPPTGVARAPLPPAPLPPRSAGTADDRLPDAAQLSAWRGAAVAGASGEGWLNVRAQGVRDVVAQVRGRIR